MNTLAMTSKAPEKVTRSTSGTASGYEAKTILFNDNVHSFEEVAGQLVKAVRCPYSKGMAIANMVHTIGHAVVYVGHPERCEAVAMVLGEINLRVLVER